MSYVTVTGKIQMVDIECIRQALKKLGAANIKISHNNLKFSINNRYYNYSIALNGVLTIRTENQQRANVEINFMSKIEENYQQVLEEKHERIRQENIRQEKIRQEKRALEKKLAQQSANISKEQQAADEAIQNKLSKLNDELNTAQQSIAEAESFLAHVEQSKQEFVTKTVDEIVTRGQNKGWTVSHNKQEANRAVTRLQLRKKQTN